MSENSQLHSDLRQAVRQLCARFPDTYWRQLDKEEGYPSDFVAAMSEAGYLAALIPERLGQVRLHACAASASGSRNRLARASRCWVTLSARVLVLGMGNRSINSNAFVPPGVPRDPAPAGYNLFCGVTQAGAGIRLVDFPGLRPGPESQVLNIPALSCVVAT